MSRKFWNIVIGSCLLAITIGLGLGAEVVRKEGWEGVWARKKAFIKQTRPEALPVAEEAERRLKQ